MWTYRQSLGICFLASAVVLVEAGEMPVAIVTGVALALLAFIAIKSPNKDSGESEI